MRFRTETDRQVQFRTKDGQLSAYAFACGYVQAFEKDDTRLEFYHSGACFHVRYSDKTHRAIDNWDCFLKLAEARKAFLSKLRQIGGTRAELRSQLNRGGPNDNACQR